MSNYQKEKEKSALCFQTMVVAFFLFSLLSCDLFTGPKVDLFQEISNEVDWSNAAKLSVRIEYPAAWGISNPQQGSITPAMDIRKGYAFSVEFTPDTAYTLSAWLAYSTSSLNALPGNWLEDPTLIAEENLESLGPGSVTLPAPNASGGTFSFTIHTTEPVTLVPWCQTQPRITRTEPRDRPDGLPYSRASDIVLYFNGAINPGTAVFADTENGDGIWITAKSLGTNNVTNINANFNEPVYAAAGGFFTVTISPTSSLPPENSLITVRVQGIKNTQGETMDGVYSFSWRTPISTDVYFNSYSASYNSGSISVSYSQTGADRTVSYYRLDKGANIPFTGTISNVQVTGTISNVQGIDASGVREGKAVSGIREYEIFIELYAEGVMLNFTSFKIWNFPGMSVSDDNPLIEIKTQAELAAMKNGLSKQYVLANDIDVSGAWEPVGTAPPDFGTDINTFQGKFYGNGHTITFNTAFANAAYTGIFGYVSNTEIRDLTVDYAVNVSVGVNATHMGGIAGRIDGNSVIRNTIVKGRGLSITSDSAICAGSICGYMQSEALIENCLTDIKLSAISTGSGWIRAGGIAGNIYNNEFDGSATVSANTLMIDGVKVMGTVYAVAVNNTPFLCIGGIIGECHGKGKIKNAIVSGTVIMSGNSTQEVNNTYDGSFYYICGGVIGKMQNGNLDTCDFTGIIELPPSYSVKGITFVGGLTGTVGTLFLQGAIGGHANSAAISVKDSNASGDLILQNKDWGKFNIGGISASAYGSSSGTVTFTNCEYRDGSISFTRKMDNNISKTGQNIGGFIGDNISNVILDNCRSNAGIISVTVNGQILEIGFSVGGFAGVFRGDASGCYSKSPIEITFDGASAINVAEERLYTGGFAGIIENALDHSSPMATISGCYAGGSIHVSAFSQFVNHIAQGGFVGCLRSNVIIKDCYALGNITLDRSGFPLSDSESIYAGGFAGHIKMEGHTPTVNRCFSTGFVMTQTVKTTKGTVYVGGIAGYMDSGSTISNCAALAPFYTIMGGDPSTRGIGRICGNTAATGLTNNYACAARLEDSATYGNLNPGTAAITSNISGKDGMTVAASSFNTQSFWVSTTANMGTGFSNSRWSFTGVGSRGYPILADVGGQ